MAAPKVEFILHNEMGIDESDIEPAHRPAPASNFLPNWYRNLPPFKESVPGRGDGRHNSTAKKCVPLLEGMTAGYVIPLWCDIRVDENPETGKPGLAWSTPKGVVQAHSRAQVGDACPIRPDNPYKLLNPWIVKTPPGYSCHFITPQMLLNHPLQLLPGVVDTDMYHTNINFPGYLPDESWRGMIPAGTPMVQVIPFKREKWSHVSRNPTDEDVKARLRADSAMSKLMIDVYRRLFHSKKQYR